MVLVRWDWCERPEKEAADILGEWSPNHVRAGFAEKYAAWGGRHEPREVDTVDGLNAVFDEVYSDPWIPRCTVRLSTGPQLDGGCGTEDVSGRTLTFTIDRTKRSFVQWDGGPPQFMRCSWVPVPIFHIREAAQQFLATGGECPESIVWRQPGQMVVLWDPNEQCAVTTVDELDALLDELDARSSSRELPRLPYAVTIGTGPHPDGDSGYTLTFIVGTGTSPVEWSAPEPPHTCASWNGATDGDRVVATDYAGELTEFHGWMPVPMADVREGARRFLTTGGQRPDNITWEPVPTPT